MEININKEILKAVQILINKNNKNLKFDKTFEAKVIRKNENNESQYIVSYGGKEMVVNSRNNQEYSPMDIVWVTIPSGNTSRAFIL